MTRSLPSLIVVFVTWQKSLAHFLELLAITKKGMMTYVKTIKLLTSSTLKTHWLFKLLAGWTIIQLAMCVAEFLKLDTFSVPEGMPFCYFLLLILYIVKKESDRWLDIRWKKRKGEFYLVAWFIVSGIMFIIDFLTLGKYAVPNRLIETLIWIIVAYSGAMISIIMHHLINSETVVSIVKLYLVNKQKIEAASKKIHDMKVMNNSIK